MSLGTLEIEIEEKETLNEFPRLHHIPDSLNLQTAAHLPYQLHDLFTVEIPSAQKAPCYDAV